MSNEPEAILLPSGEKQTEKTESECPYKVLIRELSSVSQIFNVLSQEPEAIFVPSGEKQTDVTEFECPYKV